MGSLPDPNAESPHSPPSLDEFQRQTSLMTSCTLLWKELSDHFTSLEQNLEKKSNELREKLLALDSQTKTSLEALGKRETTLNNCVGIAMKRVDEIQSEALLALSKDFEEDNEKPEVDDTPGLLLKLRSYCLKMDSKGFWEFVSVRKKELVVIKAEIPKVLEGCVDPPRFVLEAISEVFPVDKGKTKGKERNGNDLGWACVLMLESLVPVMVDTLLGKERMLITPSVKRKAEEVAEIWKKSLGEKGGVEIVKKTSSPDVHTFLQHLVTFGIVKKEDSGLYRSLVVGAAWRKQMPKLAVALGLGDQMPDIIEELINRGQQVDAVHFTYEVGLVDKFPPVPLLKAFLNEAKKAANSISEDPNNSGRAAHLAAKKEQSAIRAVIKCIEEYKLEDEFPPENLKKCVEQLEKAKTEKKKQAEPTPNKRTRASNGGPMPPAKAGRSTNAYVSSFPAVAPAFVRSPSHTQYPAVMPPYPPSPAMYSHGSRSPSYAYSPEAASPPYGGSYPGTPISYPIYGGYCNGMTPPYQQAYYL